MWTHAFLFYSMGYNLLLLLFDVQIMPDLVSDCAFKLASEFSWNVPIILWALPYFMEQKNVTDSSTESL